MKSQKLVRRAFAVVAVGALLVVGNVALNGDDTATVEAATSCASPTGGTGAAGEYHPVTPFKAFDSRSSGALRTKRTYSLKIAGRGSMPAFTDADRDSIDDNVMAVMLNFTVLDATRPGNLKAVGKGTSFNGHRVMVYDGGVTVSSAIVPLGSSGKIKFRLYDSNSVNMTVHVAGYFTTCNGARGSRVLPVGPARLVDTLKTRSPLGAGKTMTINVRGADSISPKVTNIVPNRSSVVGVVLNLTADNRRGDAKRTRLVVKGNSNDAGMTVLYPAKGEITSNLVIVPVGRDGKIRIWNRSGKVHVAADVVGYLKAGSSRSSTGGRVIPLTSSYRVINTRDSRTGKKPLGPGAAEVWSFENSINSVVGPTGSRIGPQLGMFATITTSRLNRTYPTLPLDVSTLSFYQPGYTKAPQFSNLTFDQSPKVSNLGMLSYGASSSVTDSNGSRICSSAHCIKVFNSHGYADFVVDMRAVILK